MGARKDPPLRVALWGVVVAACLPTILAPYILLRGARDESARLLALSSTSYLVHQEIATHERAVELAATRLAYLESRTPEVLERTLKELVTTYPALKRLWVCDLSGQVIATWQVGVPTGQENQRREEQDPSPPRRAAMATAPHAYTGLAGPSGKLERVEIGRVIRTQTVPEMYVAGDVATADHLVPMLQRTEELYRVPLVVVAQDGRVLYARSDRVPEKGWHGDVGYGLLLFAAFSTSGGTTAVIMMLAAAALAMVAAGGLVLMYSKRDGQA